MISDYSNETCGLSGFRSAERSLHGDLYLSSFRVHISRIGQISLILANPAHQMDGGMAVHGALSSPSNSFHLYCGGSLLSHPELVFVLCSWVSGVWCLSGLPISRSVKSRVCALYV